MSRPLFDPLRGALGCLLLLVAGCGSTVRIQHELPDAAQSSLLIVSSNAATGVYAQDGRVPYIVVSRAAGALRVRLLALARPLAGLGLVEGEIPVAHEGDGVPLPEPLSVFEAQVDGGEASAMTELGALPDELRRLRVALRGLRACVLEGGCSDALDSNGFAACLQPCPLPSTPAAPMPAEAPSLLPCPGGWQRVDSDGLSSCEPWPAERAPCPADRYQLPGAGGCSALGPECVGRFAADLPSGQTIVYVDPAEPSGGDGSLARPFDHISDGLAAVPLQGVLALASGSYSEPLALRDGVAVYGHCVAGTRIEPDAMYAAALIISSGRASVFHLTLAGAISSLALGGADTLLTASDLRIGVSSSSTSWVDAGRLIADGLVLEGERLDIYGGAQVEIRRALVVAGSLSVRDARLSASDIAVERASGHAITLDNAGLSLDRAVLEYSAGSGVALTGAASATVSDVLIRDGALGLDVEAGSAFRGRRVGLERLSGRAIASGGQLGLEDVLLREVGTGFIATAGASVELSAGRVTLERAQLRRVGGMAVLIRGDTVAELIDTTILDQPLDSMAALGTGIGVDGAASLGVHRVAIAGASHAGIALTSGAILSAEDLAIHDTLTEVGTDAFGRGVEVTGRSRAHLTRVQILNSYNSALAATHEGELVAFDAELGGVRQSACAGTSCLVAIADGLGLSVQAHAHLERFSITNLGDSGLRADSSSSFELIDGRIDQAPFAVTTQSPADLHDGQLVRVAIDVLETAFVP